MTSNEIKIRKATEQDYSPVNVLYLETDNLYSKNIPETYKKPPTPTLSRGNFLNMIEDKNAVVMVAEIEHEVAGVLYATIAKDGGNEWVKPSKRVNIEEISVLPKFARLGIGTKLLQEAEKWAQEKKIKDLCVLVYDFNKSAISFYSKNGYRPYSTQMNKKIL